MAEWDAQNLWVLNNLSAGVRIVTNYQQVSKVVAFGPLNAHTPTTQSYFAPPAIVQTGNLWKDASEKAFYVEHGPADRSQFDDTIERLADYASWEIKYTT